MASREWTCKDQLGNSELQERVREEMQVLHSCLLGACSLMESNGSPEMLLVSDALQRQVQRVWEALKGFEGLDNST